MSTNTSTSTSTRGTSPKVPSTADPYTAALAAAQAAVDALGERRGSGRYSADNGVTVCLGEAGAKALARLDWPSMKVSQAARYATYQRTVGKSAGPIRRTKYTLCTYVVKTLLTQSDANIGDVVVSWEKMLNDPAITMWPNIGSIPELLGVASGKLGLKVTIFDDGRIKAEKIGNK